MGMFGIGLVELLLLAIVLVIVGAGAVTVVLLVFFVRRSGGRARDLEAEARAVREPKEGGGDRG